MSRNRSGNAEPDNPMPSKHQANVHSKTLEPEENSRIPKSLCLPEKPLASRRFFVVPTVRFRPLSVLVILAHKRR